VIVVDILRQLKRANGPRRRKVLSASTVGEALSLMVGDTQGVWAWSSWMGYGFMTGTATVALAVRSTKGDVVLRIADGTNRRVSPGRIWADLQPWRPGTPSTERKLETWARTKAPDRVVIPSSKLPAVITALSRITMDPKLDLSDNGTQTFVVQAGAPGVSPSG
jgi:hypothetical protein